MKWLETDPIRNECTHFALAMDPKLGSVLYLKRYLRAGLSARVCKYLIEIVICKLKLKRDMITPF